MTDLNEADNPVGKAGQKQRDIVAPARIAAFEILCRVEAGAYASVLLASLAETLQPRDRALSHELVLGVLRRQLWLDHLIEHFANRAANTIDLPVRIALRLGLYQLRFLSRIPASAAVNESVNLVRVARVRSADGFVNAVLRRATREPEFDPAETFLDSLTRLSVATSHPSWLIGRWLKAFGAEETEAFATANNEAAPVSFRVVRRSREAEVLDQLQTAGGSVSASAVAEGAWRIVGGGEVLRKLAQAGQLYIQDEASQLVAQVLEAKPGDRVLDVCSAPGSKATQIARSREGITVVAGDLHEHRIQTAAQTARLQGVQSIKCIVLDGQHSLPFREAAFERVLVDAPCSGTGTLRHNPEIRWRISDEDIQDLSTRQGQLLLNASRVVKPGGRLVYSTCSVELEENEAVVNEFLENNDRFEQTPLAVNPSLLTPSGAARTWPHRNGSDGFFISAFKRKTGNNPQKG